jgi:hypothetical protein
MKKSKAKKASQPPKIRLPRRRPAGREVLKQQITVRVDKRVLEILTPYLQERRMTVTDAAESGLYLFAKSVGLSFHGDSLRGYQMALNLPRQLEQMTLAFWAFMAQPGATEYEEMFRKFLDNYFHSYRQTPQCQAGLDILASLGVNDKKEKSDG